jgi:hypothetical protein
MAASPGKPQYDQLLSFSQGDGTITYWAVIVCVGFNPHQYIQSRRDAQGLYQALVRHGWDKNHIICLVEWEATREAILNALTWLQEEVDTDDIVFFYSGTHGYMMNDQPPFDEPDGKDEFIMPFDCDWETNDNCILDDELAHAFNQIASQNMAIIIESCHSGGMIDGSYDLCKSGRVVLTGCDVDELGCPLLLRMHWLFCYYVTQGLKGKADKNRDGWVTAEEAHYYAELPVRIRSTLFNLVSLKTLSTQHPQIYDGWPNETNNDEELRIIKLRGVIN